MRGLAPVPEIPRGSPRRGASSAWPNWGKAGFHAELAGRDPADGGPAPAERSPALVRAWEVLEATGRSLADWQAEPVARARTAGAS